MSEPTEMFKCEHCGTTSVRSRRDIRYSRRIGRPLFCGHACSGAHRQNRRNQNSGKTHCVHGHELSGDNVRVEGNGQRRCLTCARSARLSPAWTAKPCARCRERPRATNQAYCKLCR